MVAVPESDAGDDVSEGRCSRRSTRDDRVHPGHARKMVAKMETMDNPFYYYENTEGGHGAGVTSDQRARTIAVTYAYLWQQLGK